MLEIKVKERRVATKKEFKIGLQQQHFQCQDKVVHQLTQWILFKTTIQTMQMEYNRITITQSFQLMVKILESMQLQVISFKALIRMDQDWQTM